MKINSKSIVYALAFSLILGCVLLPSVIGQGDDSADSFLSGGSVSPENGSWDSIFTFEVIYSNSENTAPPTGYPKVSVNGANLSMVENDANDENFVDGKVYYKKWIPGKENLGNHSFYFYVSEGNIELARNPENGDIEGPLVKTPTDLSFHLKENKKVLSFSGKLTVASENLGIVGENIIIHETNENENIFVKEVRTGEKGKFSFSIPSPKDKGIYRYDARFEGNIEYSQSKSKGVYFHNLDMFYVVSISVLCFLAVVFGLVISLTRGFDLKEYWAPVILGGLITMILLLFLGIIGLLLGGCLIGYLFSKRYVGWINQLRIGIVGGAVTFTAHSLLTLSNLLVISESLTLDYSVSQGLFLKNFLLNSLSSVVIFSVTVGLGAMIGEYLRKFFASISKKVRAFLP